MPDQTMFIMVYVPMVNDEPNRLTHIGCRLLAETAPLLAQSQSVCGPSASVWIVPGTEQDYLK